jgi:vancomycin permeability regulator SanA
VRRPFSLLIALATRGGVLLGALVILAGVVGEVRGRATDLSLWLVDVRDITAVVALPLLVGLAVPLLVWALAARPGPVQRGVAAIAATALALLCLRDVARYASAVAAGGVRPAAPIPLSLILAILLGVTAVAIVRGRGLADLPPWRIRLGVGLAFAVAAAIFPVAQIAFFGTTDYRRPAEAAVVLGARVYASGTPSPLLADRIATGVELYRSGLVPFLVMSGGDGADGWNEAEVMRDQAIAAGVPAAAVFVDRTGVNTDATVDHTIALLDDPSIPRGSMRLIAVSQAYHLPRIQLAFSGAGVDVLTVPAVDPVPIEEMPLLVAREVPAFWLYYLRACFG